MDTTPTGCLKLPTKLPSLCHTYVTPSTLMPTSSSTAFELVHTHATNTLVVCRLDRSTQVPSNIDTT